MTFEFGEARDYYRLRVVKFDESSELDLEWRDDILWRTPAAERPDEYEVFRVEAVRLDDEERRVTLGDFECAEDAYDLLRAAEEDLAEMSKSQFEAARFPDSRAAG